MYEIKLDNLKLLSYLRENEISDFLRKLVENKKPYQIITLNSLIYLESLRNKKLNTILHNSIVLPDSFGIAVAVFLLTGRLIKVIPGIDLMRYIFHLSQKHKYRIYCLGAEEGVIERAVWRIKDSYPGVNIVGWHCGYNLDEAVVSEIVNKEPEFLLVGLGSPKQELWIWENMPSFKGSVAIGVGGAFDVLSGRLKRAPKMFILLRLEWLFRFLQEPWRFFRIMKLPIFLARILFK